MMAANQSNFLMKRNDPYRQCHQPSLQTEQQQEPRAQQEVLPSSGQVTFPVSYPNQESAVAQVPYPISNASYQWPAGLQMNAVQILPQPLIQVH